MDLSWGVIFVIDIILFSFQTLMVSCRKIEYFLAVFHLFFSYDIYIFGSVKGIHLISI